MNTQHKNKDGTGTKALETLDPTGVGELATQVVINSSVNVSWETDRKHMVNNDTDMDNGHCYAVPLRLRGGDGDDDDTEMTNATVVSGDMGTASGSQKRGPPSLGSPSGQAIKQLKTAAKQPGELDDLIGWLEQTIFQEKDKRKLGVQSAEKRLGKLSRLRTIAHAITHENSKLAGEVKGKEDAQRECLTVFINKFDAKNAEVNSLTNELDNLKSARAAPSQARR
ncbi:unnamed protein product [Macrosiphum euphorbiae]|uniref:Uncharacterized protein n=1 Tax=Macrosiphum euphorbiae TaxID=13131 RepID=A0AAV0WUZ2_9HEMI|nr:unnamed protein product [Macrosiphum euphorbiae]